MTRTLALLIHFLLIEPPHPFWLSAALILLFLPSECTHHFHGLGG